MLPSDQSLYYSPEKYPKNWESAFPESSVRFGTEWLMKGEYFGMVIPSTIVPEENNLLINPLHPAIADVEMKILRSFVFDTPIFGK